MISTITITFKPDNKSVTAHSGITILEAAGRAGIILNTPCGGIGTCKKCTVLLGPERREVLACLEKLESDSLVHIPAESRFYQQQILQHGIERQIKIHPCIQKIYLPAAPGNEAQLIESLQKENQLIIQQSWPEAPRILEQINLQYEQQGVTVVLHKVADENSGDAQQSCYNILCIEPTDTRRFLYGIAVDIGTTTVLAKLIDMSTGEARATAAMANPQAKHGDDVISRIAYADSEEGYRQLHDIIIGCINSLIQSLCNQYSVSQHYIYELTAAGNTTMSHLFLNHPVRQLGQAPYRAYSTVAEDRSAREMGIDINPCGNVHVIENIAGYVGSDTTAAALAVGMDRAEETTLVVDIGTNGEVVLGTKDKMFAASCAAGPAMEGARISQGGQAVEGAIEKIHIVGDDICIHVIGNKTPRSICGSGIIDAVAVLLDLGIIDQKGRFRKPEELEGKLSGPILNRLTEKNGKPAFILAHNEGLDAEPVYFTQKDVRETQLAKGALRAGIELLKKQAGISDSDIHQILLAGAFGNYIRRRSAFRIGLLPEVPHEKVIYVGNAASTGAQMVLLSQTCRELAAELAEKIEYIEIAYLPDFLSVFTDSMMFENHD